MEEISPVDSTSFLRVSSLSFLTVCLMDFGCTQLTFTIMEVNFFPQYLSVHLSICLSIHPPYYIFFSAGPLTDILSLEVRATVEFTRVCRHECWLFLMYPPDAISTFLHLVWPETLVSVAYIGEAPFSSVFRVHPVLLAADSRAKGEWSSGNSFPCFLAVGCFSMQASFDSPCSLHLYLHV